MNFDKESKFEEFFYFYFFLYFFFIFFCFVLMGGGGGGGGEGQEEGNSDSQKISIRLLFCAHALYKISSSWLKWFSS